MEPINEMMLEFLSVSCNEAFARVVIAAFVSQIDPTLEEIADVKTAVSEAVTNAVIHGYDSKSGIIKMRARLFHNAVEIMISDFGRGIQDIKLARQPLYTSKPDMERSGMGFTMMENFMDNLEIDSKLNQGTNIRMNKKFKSLEK